LLRLLQHEPLLLIVGIAEVLRISLIIRDLGDLQKYGLLETDWVYCPGQAPILIPTTSGAAAASSENALFYVPSQRAKEAIASLLLIPALAIPDAVLRLTSPPELKATMAL
jgi:alcohol dehydrogenase class IV